MNRRILDHVCNIISKFAHHKGGPCLQLQSFEECKGLGMVSGKKVANKKEQRNTVEVKYYFHEAGPEVS